ncbi:hypothetical protein R6M67_18470 [Streptomyces sp. Wh19]|nr:hypothetical protein [Streptomyces sp. Wh19]MDV9197289.1 hypothetical protein [Streptomyces sp. Wh19]
MRPHSARFWHYFVGGNDNYGATSTPSGVSA